MDEDSYANGYIKSKHLCVKEQSTANCYKWMARETSTEKILKNRGDNYPFWAFINFSQPICKHA